MNSLVQRAPPVFIPELADHRHRPDRKRMRRRKPSDRFSGTAPIAKILVLEGGGHWRPVITRGGCHLRFRIPSLKTGLTQVGEGKGEQRFAFLNEVDANTWDYQCHPWQIISQVASRRFKYRPDAIRYLANGIVEVIEIKRTFRDLADEEYCEMLGKVKEICRQIGFRFRVLYLADIVQSDAHRENVDILFGRRYMTLSRQQERELRTLRLAKNPIPWGSARELITAENMLEGDAVLECAAARGMFAFDLTAARTDDTLFTPVAAMTGASPIRL